MIDSRFPGDQWKQLSPKETLDAIGGLVLRQTSQCSGASFFDSRQDEGEPMKKYFQRRYQRRPWSVSFNALRVEVISLSTCYFASLLGL